MAEEPPRKKSKNAKGSKESVSWGKARDVFSEAIHQPANLVGVPNEPDKLVLVKFGLRAHWRLPSDAADVKNRLSQPMKKSDVYPPDSNGLPTGLQDTRLHYPRSLYGNTTAKACSFFPPLADQNVSFLCFTLLLHSLHRRYEQNGHANS